MKSYTTQKRNVVQLSVFVLPEEKKRIEARAKAEDRTVSNYCKRRILKEVENE